MNTEDLLIQQNNLLQRQNDLLEQNNLLLQQQNKILRQNLNPATSPLFFSSENETFVENIDTDEIRSGFFVTSNRKKLWNVQIKIINEVARICKKHNIRWFAGYGTLLGAARHKGFIPWDDDTDLIMLRPDYEKFTQVAAEEIKYPYYFDNFYDYRIKEENKSLPEESDFPLINYRGGYWPLGNFLKIRDSRTTMIEFPERKNINQGIWVDIFPFDAVPPFGDDQKNVSFIIAGMLNLSTFNAPAIQMLIDKNQPLPVDINSLKNFLELTYRQRGVFLEKFLTENFSSPQYVGSIPSNFNTPKPINFKIEDFDKVTYLPFEKIEIPAPVDYDEILTKEYGDWHKMIFTPGHSKNFSANISYTEYFKKVTLQ